MKTIIGIAGVKTSGKSTAANIIKEILKNENVHESALADKLKNTCASVFNLERNQFDFQELKEVEFKEPMKLGVYEIGSILESFGIYMSTREIDSLFTVVNMDLKSPRQIAQIVGTEILRTAGDADVHCKNVNVNDNGITIISDLRFPNEFEYFSKDPDSNFIPIYIQRDEAEQYVTEDSHPSEKCVFEFSGKCKTINNNGSLEQLQYQIMTELMEAGLISQDAKRL
jgi:hypothetical protein